MAHQYRFGDFLIDQQGFQLLQAERPLAIEPKALHVLIFLVQQQGRLVERRELLTAVWGDAFVTDHVLNRAVGQLRKVLGDDAREPRYIETVPTLGYRFIAPVAVKRQDERRTAAELFGTCVEIEVMTGTREHPLSLTAVPSQPKEQTRTAAVVGSEEVAKLGGKKAEAVAAKRRFWMRGKVWSYAMVLAALAVAMEFLLKEPVATAPLESTQLTSSTDPKEAPIFTDGSRLYFERYREPSQMSVSGGKIVPANMLEPGLHLLDISLDGSKTLAWKGDGSLWSEPTVGGAARRVASIAVDAAVWTPDGQSIVYSVISTLYAMDEKGGHRTKLWEAPGQVSDLTVSPDGKQICATVEGKVASRLWILRADGTRANLLDMEWPADQDMRSAHWTLDGRHLVFRSDGTRRQNMYEVVKPDWLHFWRKPRAVALTGNQIDILASVPSRDGQGLIVLGRLDQGSMQVFDPKSKTLSPFLNGLSASMFVVSPDGRSMAYIEYPSGNLWKSRVDGTRAVQLTDTVVHFPRWSPDGKSLIYSDWHKLYQVSVDGGSPERLIPTGEYEAALTWSPDGKSVVFNYWDYVHTPHGLYVLDMATRKVSAMKGAESYFVPLWSPDGKYMAAIGENPSRFMLYSADSKIWRVLRVGPWNFYSWSADSKSIYMSLAEDRNQIYRIGVPDGSWDKVTKLQSVDANHDVTFVSVTGDGRPAVMDHTGVTQFYSLRWPR